MFLRNLNLIPFSSPEAEVSTGGKTLGSPATTEDKDDVIKFLGEDDDKEEDTEKIDLEDKKAPKKETKDESEKEDKDNKEDEDDSEEDEDSDEEDEDDELEDLLEEANEPDADKLELTTPVRKAEILKKYPSLFKDFPYLEKAYYREQAFTEVLSTVENAKEAVAKSSVLDALQGDLDNGNTEKLFTGMKTHTPESFYRTVDNLLPTLAKVDEKAYHHVIGTITKNTIIRMVEVAEESDSEALKAAAQILGASGS